MCPVHNSSPVSCEICPILAKTPSFPIFLPHLFSRHFRLLFQLPCNLDHRRFSCTLASPCIAFHIQGVFHEHNITSICLCISSRPRRPIQSVDPFTSIVFFRILSLPALYFTRLTVSTTHSPPPQDIRRSPGRPYLYLFRSLPPIETRLEFNPLSPSHAIRSSHTTRRALFPNSNHRIMAPQDTFIDDEEDTWYGPSSPPSESTSRVRPIAPDNLLTFPFLCPVPCASKSSICRTAVFDHVHVAIRSASSASTTSSRT